jgi:3-hydroxyacyl-[acyl-carrier-protein] dehydratase
MTLLNDMYAIVGNNGDTTTVSLNASHPIYQAHFPGNPITPGVCIVQMVGELVGLRLGCRLQLQRIVNLKFVSPISPIDHSQIAIAMTLVDDVDEGCRVKGTISAGGEVKTKFSMVFVPVYTEAAGIPAAKPTGTVAATGIPAEMPMGTVAATGIPAEMPTGTAFLL